jgi:hypothetical protein
VCSCHDRCVVYSTVAGVFLEYSTIRDQFSGCNAQVVQISSEMYQYILDNIIYVYIQWYIGNINTHVTVGVDHVAYLSITEGKKRSNY